MIPNGFLAPGRLREILKFVAHQSVYGDHPGYYLDSVLLGTREVTARVVDLFDGITPFRIVFNAETQSTEPAPKSQEKSPQ